MTSEATIADQSDNQALFKALTQRPKIAWPTILLVFIAYSLFGASTYAYLQGNLTLVWSVVLNSIAAYISFTPTHEASHHAVSSNRHLNDWIGRVATALQSPVPFFRSFRYIHMQHHRFTNHPSKDPDLYVGKGPLWQLPFRWVSLDLNYLFFYLRPDVVSLPTGAWFRPEDPSVAGSTELNGNPNVLTRDKGTSKLAQGPSAHTCLVEVELANPALVGDE